MTKADAGRARRAKPTKKIKRKSGLLRHHRHQAHDFLVVFVRFGGTHIDLANHFILCHQRHQDEATL